MGYDLFISYSHIDDEPWGAAKHRWVNELHKELQARLAMVMGRNVLIWRDQQVRGNEQLTPLVAAALSEARMFVFILSPRYLNSEWCSREFDGFLQDMRRRSPCGPRSPILKIIKTPVNRAELPEPVRDLLGYEFFYEEASGRFRELYPETKEFWQKVDDLAQDVSGFLLGVDAPGTEKKAVYLAECTEDVRLVRDKIRRELQQRGYRVLPDTTLPWNADELLPRIRSDLDRAALSVHLVGARYGLIPEGADRSIVEIQVEAATDREDQKSRLVWIAPEALQPAERKQEEFLQRLRQVYAEKRGTELLEQKPLEEMKTRLVEKLESPPPPPRPSPEKQRIYLICEPDDVPSVKPIVDYLRRQGYQVDLPLIEGNEQERRQDHQDTLVWCDAVLIYSAGLRQAWLRAKQRDLWKAPGWGRTKRMAAQAIYIAGLPQSDTLENLSDEFILVHGTAAFAPQSISGFLEQLRGIMGGTG